MKFAKSTVSISLLSMLLVSCGQDSLRSGVRSSDARTVPVTSSKLVFQNLNSSLSGNVMASGELKFDGGKLHVTIESDGHAASSEHIQILWGRTGCPMDADDVNGDGVIDYVEAIKGSQALVEMTSDFTSEGKYPVADELGKYSYSASADAQTNTKDLEGKVVLIHGVDASVNLADTVAGKEGVSKQASLPILCAELKFNEEQADSSTTGGGMISSSTTGEQEQTTGGKGGYQEQTTGSTTGEQEQTTGGKGGYQEQTTGSTTGEQEQTTGGKGGYQEQTTGHQQQDQIVGEGSLSNF